MFYCPTLRTLVHNTKYIDNKNIDINKSNDIVKLRGIDKAACLFLSAFYNSGWDLLFADENKNSFRQKVLYKFTPKTNPIITEIKGEKNTDKLVSIERLPLPIPVKSPKKIKEISKFFKTIKLAPNNKSERKSYAWEFYLAINTREVPKIKEAFPNLQAKKIENI